MSTEPAGPSWPPQAPPPQHDGRYPQSDPSARPPLPPSGAEPVWQPGPQQPAWQPGPQQPAWQPGPSTWQPTQPLAITGQPAAPGGQQQQDPTLVPPAFQPAAPTGRKSKPLILVAVAVALLLALGGGGWWFIDSTNRSVYGPDKVAEAYLTAHQGGDFTKALGIAAPTVAAGVSDAILDAGFAGASPSRITEVKVVRTTVDGDKAAIDVTYMLAGRSHALTLVAVREGKQQLVFDKWRLEPPSLSTVSLDKPGTLRTTVNGREVTLDEGKGVYALLPGTYEFEAESTPYLAGDKQSVTVAFGDAEATPRVLRFNITLTDALISEVRAQVSAKLTQCAASTRSVLSAPENGCPFFIDPATNRAQEAMDSIGSGTIRWSVETQPEISVVLMPDMTIMFTTTTWGKKTWKADSKDSRIAWSGYSPIIVYGTVEIIDGLVTVRFE